MHEDNQPGHTIRVEHLRFEIEGRTILNDVSFAVNAGEIFGIMGMSGSGKSTILKCLMGLIPVTSGQICICGQPIVGKTEDELNEVRKDMGMAFQYSALFDSMTAAENVAFGLRHQQKIRDEKQIQRRVDEYLEVVDMGAYGDYMPSDLSGGMRKRIGIARALVVEPQVMLYDEPTSGLDPVTAGHINELIVRLRDRFQTTSVVVTHEVRRLFRVADRVTMLGNNTVLATGTPEELRQSDVEHVRQFVEGDHAGPLGPEVRPEQSTG
ncbi:MAG: ATP-binding cassette domain-containing protein [Armatimonadota bacterium]